MVMPMDKIEHAILGSLVSLGLYAGYKSLKKENLTLQGVLGSLVLGGFAGILPDVIEPPSSPNHRGFFHSMAFLGMLSYGNNKMIGSQRMTDGQKLLTVLFSVAYGTHLASDSVTAKGIPLLSRLRQIRT
jgi:membrane-bound metal-dependent hydrolase YbcI (DUF457 family)